MSHKN
jgi:hypothetical protein